MQYTDRQTVIDNLLAIDYDQIPKPNTTKDYFYGCPNEYLRQSLFDCWLEWIPEQGGWLKVDKMLEGYICLDVETSNSTRTLALASAVHLGTGTLYAWFSNPAKYESQKLLSFPDNSFLIAHRSTFEASFIARNFVPGHPGFKSLCTYAISAAMRHPGKTAAYRAAPFASQFRASSDCSLAGLYNLATGETMDKDAVSAFIEAKDFSWARDKYLNMMAGGIYSNYLKGNAGKVWKKAELPEYLSAAPVQVYPKVTKTAIKKIDPLFWCIPNDKLSTESQLFKHAVTVFAIKNEISIPDRFTYSVPDLLSSEEYEIELQKHTGLQSNALKDAWEYNIFDTLATVEVMKMLIKDLQEMDDLTFAGIVERSTPMFFVDPHFEDHRDYVEEQFQEISNELDETSVNWVTQHLNTAGEWDGQDWTLNSDRCSAAKKGKPVWFDEKKFGFSKSLTAIAIRPKYLGVPLKRIKVTTPVLGEDGNYFFRENEALKPRGMFALTEEENGKQYEEVMGDYSVDNCRPWEHPFSSDAKKFKGVGSLFSSTLFPLWEDGQLTCDFPVKKEIKKYMELSYWRSIRKRLFNLKLVQTKHGQAVAPRTHVNGTVTGRSVDNVFLVLAKHDKKKLGSEVQGFFTAPKGYKIVQFDLDSAQARFGALISDAEYARERGWDKVQLMSTPFSKRIFKGNKKDFSTVAHELARVAGFKDGDDKGYGKGKGAQFSLVFLVGALKLSRMINVALAISEALVLSFRGAKNKATGFYTGGEASDLANGQIRMTRAEFPKGDGSWEVSRDRLMRSAGWGRKLPYVLSPVYAGNGELTTRCNATIQGGDVDFMNFICGKAAEWFNKGSIDGRFAHSVHDAFIWIIADQHVDRFVSQIKEVHKECYELLFKTWGVDLSSVPPEVWYPQTIDVTQRWLKAEGDQTKKKSSTVSFDGFEGLEGDDDYGFESLTEYN